MPQQIDRARYGILPAVLLCLLTAVCPGNLRAQSIFGQNGTILGPTADTYPNGNFTAGGYFRSLYSGQDHFDVLPIYLLIGVAPDLDIGFSFPAVWGGTNSPSFTDDYAQLGMKWRLRGSPADPWRLALAVVAQRGMITAASDADESSTSAGLELVSSHKLWRNLNGHFYGGGILASGAAENQGFLGIGIDRFIGTDLQFIGDVVVASERRKSAGTSAQALIGIRYTVLPNIRMTIGGGPGLAAEELDWQYAIGLSFSSEILRVNLFEGEDEQIEPPPLAEVRDDVPPPASGTETLPPSPEPGGVSAGQFGQGEVELTSRLFYDFAGYRLGENESGALRELRNEIADIGDAVHLRLIGHADYVGSDLSNSAWGLARSLNLTSKLLLDSDSNVERFILSSRGEILPSDLRKTEAANQLNRRVVVRTWYDFENALRDAQRAGQVWPLTASGGESYKQNKMLGDSERLSALDALREIHDLDSTEILMISAEWTRGFEPWSAFRRASALWLFLVSNTWVRPDQLAIHLESAEGPAASMPGDAPPFTVKLRSRSITGNRMRLALKVEKGLDSEDVMEGYLVVVADDLERRTTSYGDTLLAEEEPDPNQGRHFRFRRRIFPVFSIPLLADAGSPIIATLNVYDMNKDLLGRYPFFHGRLEDSWNSRIADALDVDNDVPVEYAPLSIRKLRLSVE